MKKYLENVFDAFVIVATIISGIVGLIGLFSLIVGSDKIPLWIEVIAIVVFILGGAYMFTEEW